MNSLNTGNAAVKAAGAAAAGAFATGTKSATALVAVRSSAYALRDGFYQVLTDPAFLGRLYDAGAAWARKVNAGIEAFALIASPSRLMIEQGQFLAEGFLIGVQDPATLASLGGAGESLASAVTSSLDVSTVGASLFDSVADGFSAQAGTTGLAVPIEPVTLAVSPLVAEVPPLSPVDLPVKPAVGPIVIPDLAPVTVQSSRWPRCRWRRARSSRCCWRCSGCSANPAARCGCAPHSSPRAAHRRTNGRSAP